jgi:hypothetical protein
VNSKGQYSGRSWHEELQYLGFHVLPFRRHRCSDQLGVTQTRQDIACCDRKFPRLTCRPVSAQFMADDAIALFELTLDGQDVKVVEEKHYRLVPSDEIGDQDLKAYSRR